MVDANQFTARKIAEMPDNVLGIYMAGGHGIAARKAVMAAIKDLARKQADVEAGLPPDAPQAA